MSKPENKLLWKHYESRSIPQPSSCRRLPLCVCKEIMVVGKREWGMTYTQVFRCTLVLQWLQAPRGRSKEWSSPHLTESPVAWADWSRFAPAMFLCRATSWTKSIHASWHEVEKYFPITVPPWVKCGRMQTEPVRTLRLLQKNLRFKICIWQFPRSEKSVSPLKCPNNCGV